jgi:GTPase
VRAAVESRLPRPEVAVRVLLPYERGDLINRIHQAGEIITLEHTEEGTLVSARVLPSLAGELALYAVTTSRSASS